MIRKITLAVFLAVALSTTACHKSTTAVTTPAVPVDQRIAQYVQILATANLNAANVVVSLKTAGVLTDDQAAQIAVYQVAIAKATAGMSQILAQPGSWYDKSIQIQNLALSLVPPSHYDTFGVSSNMQFQALVTALNACESTIKIIVQMSVQTAQAAPAAK